MHTALWAAYQLHYTGFDDVDDRWEWDPDLLRLRRALEDRFLAELLYDELGAGRPERLHSVVRPRPGGGGLDDEPGAWSVVPGVTLAFMNTMNLLSLHRGHAAAALGHFGAYEATSSVPSRLVVAAAERLGFPASVRAYFDEHVEADAVHEQLALRDISGGVAEADPSVVPELFFGAAVCLLTDADVSQHLLSAWGEGRSSLSSPWKTSSSREGGLMTRRRARSRPTADRLYPLVRSWCGVPARSWTPRVSPTR